MYLSWLLLTLFYVTANSLGPSNQVCQIESPCLCRYVDGRVIDLQPISKVTSNFLFTSNNSIAYFYQPCQDLPLPSNATEKFALWKFNATTPLNTTNLDGLQILQGLVPGNFTPIFHAGSASFIDTELFQNSAKIQYHSDNTTSLVKLVCAVDAPTSLSIEPTTPPYTNVLTLTSGEVCVHFLGDDMGLSTGTILLLSVTLIFSVYFFGGMLVKRSRGAEGLELIPNIESWKYFWGLVKDGFVFAMTCGRIEAEPYERI